MNTVAAPAFQVKNVEDCNTLNEVVDVVGAENYRSVSIQEYIGDRIRNAADCHFGAEFAYKLDDVIGTLSHEFDNHRGIIAPTGETWVVSDTYDLLQPREAFAIFQPVLDQYSGAKFKRAGYLQGGRRMFVEVTIGKFDIDRTDRKVGDVLEQNVTLYTGFDGSAKTDISESLYRLWCSNGCAGWTKNWSASCKHTANQRVRLHGAVEKLLQSNENFHSMSAKLNQYATTATNRETARKVIETVFPGETTRTINRRSEILEQFTNPQRGAFGETVFDIFNAFTAYQTHETNYRTTATASREENRFNAINLDGSKMMTKIVNAIDTVAMAS